ncbi:MAG TPA: DUF4178 domain-containing protein [Bacteroidales bacterium]|nr:DUF4178 domain-containing protein [Bacteroidales bacterium]
MSIFNFFKKKKVEEPTYDPTNLSVFDLEKGFIFEYNMKNWEVAEVYEYDWGNNFITREYKIDSGDEVLYLSVEDDDEVILSVMRKIKARAIDENLPETIIKNERPPQKLEFEGKIYLLDEELPGYFQNIEEDPDNWSEFISWDYEDQTEKFILCVEQWGERSFEAAVGFYIEQHEIRDITPGKTNV